MEKLIDFKDILLEEATSKRWKIYNNRNPVNLCSMFSEKRFAIVVTLKPVCYLASYNIAVLGLW